MSAPAVRVSRRWLALREPADAAARSLDLVERLRGERPATERWIIHDLGAGTGAMGRWLAPLLPGPQRWILHDRDADLLALAAASPPTAAADGAAVTLETRRSDITRLRPHDLDGASLITASALLDMLTGEELAAVIGGCARAGCPSLLTLTVLGRVSLTPPDPLDDRLALAFNAHQRRVSEHGKLLGPDAAACAADDFGRLGAEVLIRPSPWRLGPEQAELVIEWLTGWVGAACEQEAGLSAEAQLYVRRRRAQLADGELRVSVEHADVLAYPSVSKRGESA